MATLYELSDEYMQIMQELEYAETDEDAAAAWERFDSIQDDIVVKAENYARMMKQFEADAQAYKIEAQRLAKLQKNAEKSVEGLKTRLLETMQRIDVPEIKTGIGRWKVQMNPWKCTVVDEALVPAEYREPQPDKIDRKALTDAFKTTGEIIPGCEFTQSPGIRFR